MKWLIFTALFLVGCENFTKHVNDSDCSRAICEENYAGKPILALWTNANVTLDLRQGSFQKVRDCQTCTPYYISNQYINLIYKGKVCEYHSDVISSNLDDGSIYFEHTDPECDFGPVKFSKFQSSPYFDDGLYLEMESTEILK